MFSSWRYVAAFYNKHSKRAYQGQGADAPMWTNAELCSRSLTNMAVMGVIMFTVLNNTSSNDMLPSAGDSQAHKHEGGLRAESYPASTTEN